MERKMCPSCGRHHSNFDQQKSIEETGACLSCRAEFVWESEGGYVRGEVDVTESTEIIRTEKGFTVRAHGGYDGFVMVEFDTIEEALEYVTHLWSFK